MEKDNNLVCLRQSLGTRVEVIGYNFQPHTVCQFGRQVVEATCASPTCLVVRSPASPGADVVAVEVSNNGGMSWTSDNLLFHYYFPANDEEECLKGVVPSTCTAQSSTASLGTSAIDRGGGDGGGGGGGVA